MKIVCDSCSAKYSIADEKVAGRVFKIRCKKCGAAIVVRGDQVDAGGEDESTRVVDYGGEAVWHVVVDGDQHGPYAPSQIGEMLSAGTIGWDAYVWREGFDDWKPAQDIEELVSAVMGEDGGGQAPEGGADDAGGAAAAADPFGGASPDQASPFAGGDQDEGADLFAQSESASPFGGGGDEDDDVVSSATGPRVSADQALTGARNENSVLFSLSNLQALATGGSGGGSGSAPAAAPAAARPGMASGEGSGLIDIRALASATGVTGGGGGGIATGPVTSANDDRIDDLLSIGGTGAAGLGSSLGAPVLIPEQKEESSNKGLIIGLGVGGIAVIAAAAVVAIVLTSGNSDPAPVAASGAVPPGQVVAGAQLAGAADTTATGAAAAANAAAGVAPGAGAAPTPPPAAESAADEGSDEAEDEADDEAESGSGSSAGGSRSGRSARRGSRSSGSTRASASGSASASTPTPAAASSTGGGSRSGRSGGGDREIDDLLAGALGGGGSSGRRGGGSSAPARSSGPEAPSRTDVVSAMNSVSGAVSACAQGQSGLAPVRITFSNNGRVQSANVSGSLPGGVKSCISRAVRSGARVPSFTRSSFTVNYPFRL